MLLVVVNALRLLAYQENQAGSSPISSTESLR